MRLKHGLHLAYCTNVHRGETWEQTFQALQRHTLAVRDRVCAGHSYAIGLRLGAVAARELADPETLRSFRDWLDREDCYVFTINGFPYGQFHGTRVKERVYAPDWSTRERLDYTRQLFDLVGALVPAGVQGSVSTVPVSFKGFHLSEDALRESRRNLWTCVEHIEQVSRRTGRDLHLGLEPEPLCVLETIAETTRYFEQLRADRPGDTRVDRFLGVNYDCCHLAVEFEEAPSALQRLREAGIRLSKVHLSNALKLDPTPAARAALREFADDTYFHQVIQRSAEGSLRRFWDLPDALAQTTDEAVEWRVHFHIPLHAQPTELFDTTADHLLAVMDEAGRAPERCSHFEMETYTWEVMPTGMRNCDVVEQLVSEYDWTLARLRARNLVEG